MLSNKEEFIPFEPAPSTEPRKEEIQQQWISGDAAFSIHSNFWESLLKDAWIRKEIDRIVEERVELRFKTEMEARLVDAVESEKQRGYAEGFKEGSHLGETEARKKNDELFEATKKNYIALEESILNRMNGLSVSILERKQQILEDHERVWLQTLEKIISKLPLTCNREWLERLQSWMDERMSEFKTHSKLTVYLSATEFGGLVALREDLSQFPWSFQKDETLQPGDLRVECGDGGIFFSKADVVDTLSQMIGNNG